MAYYVIFEDRQHVIVPERTQRLDEEHAIAVARHAWALTNRFYNYYWDIRDGKYPDINVPSVSHIEFVQDFYMYDFSFRTGAQIYEGELFFFHPQNVVNEPGPLDFEWERPGAL